MTNWLRKFMVGRYGMDQLSIGLIGASIFLSILSRFVSSQIIVVVFLMVSVIAYCRIFSKNITKRYQENNKFLKIWNPISNKVKSRIQRLKDLKYYRYYKCPSCKQTLRVPKGKGKISINCPKCKTSIIKKT